MTSRQKRVGVASREAKRRRLVEAASREFLEQGYAATTVAALARRAEVSVQTLYLAVGGKRDLLRAVLEEALSGTSGPVDEQYLPRLRSQTSEREGDGATPRTRLLAIAHVYCRIAERAAPWWQLYREAARNDDEIAADWSELQRLRRGTLAALLEGVPDDALRPDLAREDAVDTLWTVASPETHDLLVGRLGYSPERYEAWVGRTLVGSLLPDDRS